MQVISIQNKESMNTVTLSPSTYKSAAAYARKRHISIDTLAEEAILKMLVLHIAEPPKPRDYFSLSELRGIIAPDDTGKNSQGDCG